MAIHTRFPRASSGLLPILFSLGALHCDDGALMLPAPPAPASEDPAQGSGEPTGNEDPAGGELPTTPDPDGDDPTEPGDGNGDGDPSDGDPSDGDPNQPAPYGACRPRAVGGPFWLTEGETLRIGLECATGAALPGEAFQLVEGPATATIDAATRTLSYTPGLSEAGVSTFRVGITGTNDVASIDVDVADRFGTAGNVPVDPATYTHEFGLPVLHLSVDPNIDDQEYRAASITYRGHSYVGAEAKYRGQTSLRYPKKSFTLKFAKEDRFGDALSVAGFTGKRKVTLSTTFDDNSYLRARLAFELWNRIGVEHVQVQAYNVVVYLNGEFWGIYTLADHVDRHLMEDNGLYEDGNLYKARTHDANFRSTRHEDAQVAKVSLSEGYTKEEGTPLDGEPAANADLESLVGWVATSSPQSFLAELGSRVALREYEDWWMLVSLIIAGDSAGKNSYHYRDPRAGADGRFHVVPWDFNDSFGQTWYTDRAGREASRHPEELLEYNRLFERLLGEPATRAPLIARYQSALQNEWQIDSVLHSFDTWSTEIERAATRDETRWAASYATYFGAYRSSFTTHAEEIDFLRRWLIERWAYVGRFY